MKKWMLTLAVVVLLVAVLVSGVGCSKGGNQGTTVSSVKTPEGTTVSSVKTPEGTLTVALATIAVPALPSNQNYTSLKSQLPQIDNLAYTKPDGSLIPGLALRWEVSPDEKSLTYYLRQGVPFQDGWGEMTSADWKYTFDLFKDPWGGTSVYKNMWGKNNVDRVETNGRYAFTIYFTRPIAKCIPDMLGTRTTRFMPCVSENQCKTLGLDEANKKPAFTGPYRLVEAVPGDHITYEAVENHWRVVPEFKTLIFKEVPEASTRVAMIKNGEADIAEVTSKSAQDLKTQGFDYVSIQDSYHLSVNLGGLTLPDNPNYDPKLPWLDQRVRDAMSLAINRDSMAKSIFYGTATPTGFSFSFPPYTDNLSPYAYDPVRAKQLLKDAGYSNGFPVEIWTAEYAGQVSELPDVMQAVAGYWEAIGLQVKITSASMAQVGMLIYQRKDVGKVWFETDFWRGYKPYVDGLKMFWSTPDAVTIFYEDPVLNALIQQGLHASNAAVMDTLDAQIIQYIYNKNTNIPLLAGNIVLAKGKKVGEWVVPRYTMNEMFLEYIKHSPPIGTFRLFTPY